MQADNGVDRGAGCLSEGSEPVVDPRITKLCFDDSGNASLNARRLLDGKYGDKNKVEIIRPGQFMPGPIRETGLKRPLLIKGDRYNFNPQMGVALTDTVLTASELESRMDKDREVETWDVTKQRPGPLWKLGQFTTYWHARQEYVARTALQEAKQQTVAAGQYGDEAGMEEDFADTANSGQLLVLQRQGGLPAAAMLFTPQVGIAPEQATKLYSGEFLSMENPAALNNASARPPLTEDIHPPPTILSVDLVHILERHVAKDNKGGDDKANDTCSSAKQGGDKQGDRAEETASQQPSDRSTEKLGKRDSERSGAVPAISPNHTIHLQMTPVGCFNDFKAAPGGAATWLYVLTGRKVLALLPPTAKNRSLYMAWAQASLAQTAKSLVLDVFLADYAQDAMRVEVKQNEALLIPSGWFYASVATQDCISVSCFFWHPYALGDMARTQHLQLHLKQRDTELCKKARQLMWCAALHYAKDLRARLGLQAYRAARPAGSAHTTPSNSQGSGLQQQLLLQSPRAKLSMGAPLPAAAGLAASARKTPRGTPPMTGFAAGMQQAADILSPTQSPSARRGTKRGRSEAMDTLQLPESAIPMSGMSADAAAAAAASAGGSKTPRATSSAAAAAAMNAPTGHKKLKISTFSAGGAPAGPRSTSKGGSMPQRSSDTHSAGAAPSHSHQEQQLTSSGTPRLRLKGSTARQQQQQQDRQRWSYYSAAAAGAEDDEEGDCQTSPVRHPPADDDYLDMFDQHASDTHAPAAAAAAAGTGRTHQQQGRSAADAPGRSYRQVDMSPIVGGVKGDVDALPALNMGPTALQRPIGSDEHDPARPAGAAAASWHGAAAVAAQQQLTGSATPPPAGVAVAGVTPRASRLKLKKPGRTPSSSAAGTGAPTTSAATGAAGTTSVGQPLSSEAAAVGETTAGNSPHTKSADTAGAPAATDASRRSSPEESCCRNSSHGQHQQGSGSNGASHQQQQQCADAQHPPPLQQQQQRRLSDSANSHPAQQQRGGCTPTAAAGAAGSKSGLKLKLRMPTPSPQLAPLLTTGVADAALPPLHLGQGAVQQQQREQQQEQSIPAAPAASIPQVDGAADASPPQTAAGIAAHAGRHSCVSNMLAGADGPGQLQGRQQQQQQCHLWARWQQLQAQVHRQAQQQQQRAAGDGCDPSICQCDGAGDDVRVGDAQGPTLVMQPALARDGMQQQQQQQQPQHHHQQQQQGHPHRQLGMAIQPTAPHTLSKRLAAVAERSLFQEVQKAPRAVPSNPPVWQAAAPGVENGFSLHGSTQQQQQQPGNDRSPFEAAADAGGAAGGNAAAAAGLAAAVVQDVPAGGMPGEDVIMTDADPQAAAAAGTGGAAGEGVLGCMSRVGSSLPSATAELSAAAAGGSSGQPVSRTGSPTEHAPARRTTPPLPGAAAGDAAGSSAPHQQQQQHQWHPQQQQQPMLPPLPTKVSSWELAELPVLLQYLQEQVAAGDLGGLSPADLPPGVVDPGYMLEQLEEAVEEAAAREQGEVEAMARKGVAAAATVGAGATSLAVDVGHAAGGFGQQQQQAAVGMAAAGVHAVGRAQQARPRTLPELAAEAAAWQELCGDLHPEPLQPDTMQLAVEFTTALQQGFEVQRTLGWGEEQQLGEVEAVVAETDPAPASSYHSAGSYQSGAGGTARAAQEAALARGHQGGVKRGDSGAWSSQAGGGMGGGGAGGAGAGAKRAAAAPPGNKQAAQQKKAQDIMKKLLRR